MDNTENLGLPYIMGAQAQKHVTHNEALRMLDGIVQLSVVSETIATPPASPNPGDRYIVPSGAADEWAGQENKIAAWQDGAWAFLTPVEGWLGWVVATGKLKVFDTGQWQDVTTGGGGGGNDPDPQFNTVGINSSADTTNRLSLSAPATLFNHAGNGHQIKINKAAAGDTASLLYQTAFSGRAEMGLAGSGDFSIKVSADGANWSDALTIDGGTGTIAHKAGSRHSFGHDASAAGLTILPEAGDPTSPQNGDIWYNSSLGKFRKHQDGSTSDLDTASTGGGGGGSGMPGGASAQVQFNDSGAFAGAAFLAYNKVSGDLSAQKTITIQNTSDSTTGVIRKGSTAFIHAYGTNNLFFGGSSGNFTLTGSNNAAFGAFSLTKVTTGQHNLAFGAQALNDATTGLRNVAIGSSCLTDLVGGSFNIGIGASALQLGVSGSRNLGLGYQTLYNCDASDNISMGYRSGFNVSSGTYNIFIGRDAGGGIETGGGNVVIGRQSGLPATLANTIILATGGGVKRMEIDSNGHAAFEGAVRLKSHTVASLPSASVTGAGAMVFVSDETGGAVPAYSDGVAWRRTSDRSVVS